MAETTGIAWTDHSWSPWIGCTKVSPGCDHCYAEALDKRHRYGAAVHWGVGVPRYRTKSWHIPITWNKKAAAHGQRRTVFPSLCDPFDNEVPEEWRKDLWDLITLTPVLTWLLLTKRIGNAEKMLHPWRANPLRNVWIGSSVVNQEEADRDINKLLATPAAKRFVSYEPALGPVNFKPWLRPIGVVSPDPHGRDKAIDWLIIGGESKQGGAEARPFNGFWADDAIAQCRAAGVPVFMKQMGSRPFWQRDKPYENCDEPRRDRAGADPSEWPESLRVQEIPA